MFKIFLVAALLATSTVVANAQCTANVMIGEVDTKGQSGTDRLKLGQIEVITPGPAYVRLATCTGGTRSMHGAFTLPCNGNGCQGTANLSWFGTDVVKYAGSVIHFNHQQKTGICCPPGFEAFQYAGHNFIACAGNPEYNPGTQTFDFPPGAVSASSQVQGNLTTYKSAWTQMNVNQPFIGNVPAVSVGRCTNSPQSTYNFPPFVKDRASLFFKHLGTSGAGESGPGSEMLSADKKYSAFVDVESKPDANGDCKTYVVLGDNSTMEQAELVSIDGVAFSCMALSWTNTPTEFIAEDAIVSLLALTNAAPKGNEKIKVGLKRKGEAAITEVEAALKYSYWRQLNAKLKAKGDQMQGGQQKFKCWRSDQQQNYRYQSGAVTQKCSRSGVTRSENSEKAIAFSKMSSNMYSFVSFINSRNIQTGQPGQLQSATPAPWTSGNCTLSIANLYNADGNPICQPNILVKPKSPVCDYKKMSKVVEEMNAFMASVKAGDAASDWEVIMQYQGKDTWAGCAALVRESLIDGTKQISIKTDKCTEAFPDTQGTSEREFCAKAENSNNAWCTDPCCNEDLQETMCCRVQTKTFERYDPSVDKEKLGENCPFGNPSDIPAAIDSAMSYTTLFNSPDICFAKKKTFDDQMKTLQNVPDCCYKSVVGTYDSSTGTFKTNQKCSTDDDCFSGSCNVVAQSSQGTSSQSSSSKCFTTEEQNGKNYYCNPAESSYVSTALAACMLDRLANQPKSIAYLKDRYANGDQTANAAALGAGLASKTQDGTCRGENGHRYDPHNGCQFFNTTSKECARVCDGPSDCKAKCLQDTTCNWKPYDWSNFQGGEPKKTTAQECLATDLSTSFCAARQPWGMYLLIYLRLVSSPLTFLFQL